MQPSLSFWKHGRFVVVAAPFFWTTLVALAWYYGWFGIQDMELRSHSKRFQSRGPQPPDERIVYIGISEQSILGESQDEEETAENPGYELLSRYPFPRKAYAMALERLVQAGAKVVVFDLLFSEPSPRGSGPEGKMDDLAFGAVIRKFHQHTVLGANITERERMDRDKTTSKPGIEFRVTMPISSLLPTDLMPDEDLVGYVNYVQMDSGLIRIMQPVGWPTDQPISLQYSVDALAVKKAFPEIPLPPKHEARWIDFAGPQETYFSIPFYYLFTTLLWQEDRPPLRKGKLFQDKIVIIGPQANFLHDSHKTPWSTHLRPSMDGAEIHAHAIATLLHQKDLKEIKGIPSLFVIFGMNMILCLGMLVFKSPLLKLIPAGLLVGYYQNLAQWTFNGFDLFLPVVPVDFAILGSSFLVITFQGVIEQFKKRQINRMLHRDVSKNIADELIKSGENLESLRTPKRRVVTILMSDVRDFTTMTEAAEPGPFVQQLNEYLTEMVDCVFKYNGTNDKFVGDAVMAVFGNPTSYGVQQDAWNAVQTALEMKQRLAKLNERWIKLNKPPFRIGIGINHGEVMAGDIGSDQKAEFGVIGDTVNVAARVESLTKEQKTDILITEPVYELVRDRVVVEERGNIKVKGRHRAVTIYALLGLQSHFQAPKSH